MAHKRGLAHPAHHLEQVLVRRNVVVAHVAGAHLVKELLRAGQRRHAADAPRRRTLSRIPSKTRSGW